MDGVKGVFWPSGKKGLGSPLYLEEDGPILGVIDDIFLDKKTGRPAAYRVLASGQYLEIPAEAVTETPSGFTYRSPWFTEADTVVRKLESQELLMPELLFASVSTSDADRKLLGDAVDHSPALKKLVAEGQQLYDALQPRIEALEREKFKVVGELAELAEGLATARLPKEIHRERFITVKRRLQVLEASLHRADSLRRRLENVPFIVVRGRPEAAAGLTASTPGLPAGAVPVKQLPPAGVPSAPVPRPPGTGTEEWRHIKKFRVLKAEKDLRQKEETLKRMEEEFQKSGGLTPDVLQVLVENSQALSKAIAQGGGPALKTEIEKLLSERAQAQTKAETHALGSALASPGAANLGARPAGKTCPLCAEPLTGRETTCPGCQADLRTLQAAKSGTTGPSSADKFMKGGGATKLGVVLLLASALTFVTWAILH